MLRDQKCSADDFRAKFTSMKKKLDEMESVRMDSYYFEQMHQYILDLYNSTVKVESLSPKEFELLREPQMSHLNRLQKLKNSTTYKKDKHRLHSKNEDWGE